MSMFSPALSLFAGCVLPVAPEFQDPLQAPNYPPSFVRFAPNQGTAAVGLPQDFSVELDDPNPRDILYVRWVLDYPPYVQSKSKLVLEGGELLPGAALPLATYSLATCDAFSGEGEHSIVVIVSDRPFQKTSLFVGPDRYNQVEGNGVPIMTWWTVPTCQ